jgi:hypothetical protein
VTRLKLSDRKPREIRERVLAPFADDTRQRQTGRFSEVAREKLGVRYRRNPDQRRKSVRLREPDNF